VSLLGHFGSAQDDAAVGIERERLAQEFLIEAPNKLRALPQVIARRSDTDDILVHFQLANQVVEGGFPFAVVHLSWSGRPESEMFRRIEYFESWSHLEADGIAGPSAEFGRPPQR
jgi:hypothetical protein